MGESPHQDQSQNLDQGDKSNSTSESSFKIQEQKASQELADDRFEINGSNVDGLYTTSHDRSLPANVEDGNKRQSLIFDSSNHNSEGN